MPTSPQSSPSEDMLVVCPKLEELPFDNMGDAASAALAYIAEYSTCARTHNALVEYERKRK